LLAIVMVFMSFIYQYFIIRYIIIILSLIVVVVKRKLLLISPSVHQLLTKSA